MYVQKEICVYVREITLWMRVRLRHICIFLLALSRCRQVCLFMSHRGPPKDNWHFERPVFKYLHLISKPLEGYKPGMCSYDKKANAELYAQTPEHWPPHHLKTKEEENVFTLDLNQGVSITPQVGVRKCFWLFRSRWGSKGQLISTVSAKLIRDKSRDKKPGDLLKLSSARQ